MKWRENALLKFTHHLQTTTGSLPLFLSHIFFTSRKNLKLVSEHTDERTNKQKQPLIFPSSALTSN